jgi:hypothetical protein
MTAVRAAAAGGPAPAAGGQDGKMVCRRTVPSVASRGAAPRPASRSFPGLGELIGAYRAGLGHEHAQAGDPVIAHIHEREGHDALEISELRDVPGLDQAPDFRGPTGLKRPEHPAS